MYDQDEYDDQVARSANTLNYQINPNYAINCRANNQFVTNESIGNKIDVDSLLKGITKPQNQKRIAHQPSNIVNQSNDLASQSSRFTHPAYDIRGMQTKDMRFDYPLHDPQCQIFENFEINTRLQAKDNHKAIWQVPLDQSDAFPRERHNGSRHQNNLNSTYASCLY